MDILETLAPLRRYWWLVLLGTLVAVAAAFWTLRQQPAQYQASATLAIGRAIKSTQLDYNEVYLSEQLANTYADIAKRRPVRQATMQALGLTWLPEYAVRTVPSTQLLEIIVTDNDPARAQAVANELARQLVEQGPAGQDSEAAARRTFVKAQLNSLETKIQETEAEITAAQAALGNMLSAREIADAQNQILALQNKLATLQANYAALLANTEEGSANTVTVIETADLPTTPIGPNAMRTLLLVGALGFLLAAGTAYLLHYLDDTVKTPDDVKKTLELTTLGAVPKIEGVTEGAELVALSGTHSSAAEAYRVLRTNLQFAAVDHPVRVLQVTSPAPTEGKSINAANLAVALAQAGRRVVIVDGDLHRPRVHRVFGLPNNAGLTTALVEDELALEPLLQPTSVPGLSALTSGPLPPNPAELLGSEKARALLVQLAELADLVVVDSPPVLILSDAAVLATQCDGVLLVVEAGGTRRRDAQRAAETLRRVNARILGVLLNRVPTRGGGYYYYYYHKDYGYRDGSSSSKGGGTAPSGAAKGRRQRGGASPAPTTANATQETTS